MTAMYCSVDTLRNALRGTSQDGEGTAAELDDSQLEDAIIQASSIVSSYAGVDYETDQFNVAVNVPQLVRSLGIDFSCFYATMIYRKGKAIDQYDPVYLRYQLAKSIISDLVSGKIEANPGKPNEAPEHQGRAMNTVPSIFQPKDSGTRITSGAVRHESVWPSGYSPWDY